MLSPCLTVTNADAIKTVPELQAELKRCTERQLELFTQLAQSQGHCQWLTQHLNHLVDLHEANDPVAVVLALGRMAAGRAQARAAKSRPH